MTPLDQLAHARRFLSLGFSVIPVPPPRPGTPEGQPGDGKTPSLKWGIFQTRRPTDAELLRWFGRAPMNLAVVTGTLSGMVVIDADDPAALRWCVRHLIYTPWQTRTARGFHLWYRHPGIHVPNRSRLETRDGKLAIDVRGDGGFVIAAGSMHASGVEYVEAGDWTLPRERLPVFWPGWLQRAHRPTRPTPSQRPRPTGSVVERARRYLAGIPTPVIGQASDTATLKAACRLVRGFELDATVAEDLLWEWAGGRTGWTREWIADKVAHAQRYGTEPIGALR